MNTPVKIIAIVAFVFLGIGAQALPLSYSPGKSLKKTVADPWYEDVWIDFTNTSTAAITLDWTGYQDQLPAGWQIGMCNNGECRPDVLTPGSLGTLQPNQSAFLKLHISAAAVSGTAKVRFVVYDKNNPTERDTLEYEISFANTAGICDETCNYENLKLEQSETAIALNGGNNFVFEGEISIFDITGKLLFLHLFENQHPLPVGHLPKGIYIIALNDGNRKVWQQKFYKF